MSARLHVKGLSNIITTGHISWKSLKNGIWVINKNQFKSKLHYSTHGTKQQPNKKA